MSEFTPTSCPACFSRTLVAKDETSYLCQTCSYYFAYRLITTRREHEAWWEAAKLAAYEWKRAQRAKEKALALAGDGLVDRMQELRRSTLSHPLSSRLQWKQAIQRLFAGARFEISVVAYLDAENHVLSLQFEVGNVYAVNHPPTEIAGRAAEVGATKLIVAHNHPAFGATPSDADVEWAAVLYSLAKEQCIELVDDVVLCGTDTAALRSVLQTRRFRDLVREY